MNEALVTSICNTFDLGKPCDTQAQAGTRTQSFIVHTESGTWFARRRHPAYSQPARIEFDHAALAFLHKSGAAVVAPRQTKDGKTIFERDGELWEVFTAIRNRSYREGDPSEARLLGEALTKFHLASQRFDRRYDKLGPRGETSPTEMRAIAARIRSQTPSCENALQRYESWLESAAAQLTDEAYSALPHTLIHGDVQPANVLMDGNRVAVFVDVDWCAWRPRVYDLAFAILLCCSTHESPIDGSDIWSLTQPPNVSTDCIEQFLTACAKAGWPVEEPEKRALAPQVLLSWCHCRLAGALKVEPARREEFLSRPPTDAQTLLPIGLV